MRHRAKCAYDGVWVCLVWILLQGVGSSFDLMKVDISEPNAARAHTNATSSMLSSSRAKLLSLLVPQSQLFKSISSLGAAWLCERFPCVCVVCYTSGWRNQQGEATVAPLASTAHLNTLLKHLNIHHVTHKRTCTQRSTQTTSNS